MIGRISIKRFLKKAAGCAAAAAAAIHVPKAARRACIFVYHRVADISSVDPHFDDWNVSPRVFEVQIAALSRFCEIVALADLPLRLQSKSTFAKPLVCLTFDDAYGNFYTNALPILQRYQAPATVFAVTSQIGNPEPMPFDSWSRRNYRHTSPDVWRSMTWSELEGCLDSGFVTVGGHSHRHSNGLECTDPELEEEASRSFEILQKNLGDGACRHYAYPYGSSRLGQVSAGYVQSVRSAGYETAVTTDLGLVSPNSEVYLLPRIEAHGVDGPRAILAKARGILAPFYLTDRMRSAKRPSAPSRCPKGGMRDASAQHLRTVKKSEIVCD